MTTDHATSRAFALITLCAICLACLTGLALAHALRVPFYAGDDLSWQAHASQGLQTIWTEPSPFRHYRPVFGTWLHVLGGLGADSPAMFGLGALLLYLAAGAMTFWALRPLIPARVALVAAMIVTLHPARQQHLFWISAGNDALCLLLSLLAIGIAFRAYQAPRLSPARLLFAGTVTALAILSKEVALLLPPIVLLAPVPAPLRRRLALAGASAAGAIIALVAAWRALPQGGRPRGLLQGLGAPGASIYPLRLLWPGDHEAWFYQAQAHGSFGTLALVACITIAAAGLLAWAWRGRWLTTPSLTGILLIVAGAMPWIIRQEDRGIGLGVIGVGLLAAGAVAVGPDLRPRPATLMLLLLALLWSPLWLRWEGRWFETGRLGLAIADSAREWRASSGVGPLLVALGAPSKVGWSCEVLGLEEIDPCSISLLGVQGPLPLSPLRVETGEPEGRIVVSASGESLIRWSTRPVPGLGVIEVHTDRMGYVRGGVVQRSLLEALPGRLGCRGLSVRSWAGERFERLPAGDRTGRQVPRPAFHATGR